jgi:hypothetical protein
MRKRILEDVKRPMGITLLWYMLAMKGSTYDRIIAPTQEREELRISDDARIRLV